MRQRTFVAFSGQGVPYLVAAENSIGVGRLSVLAFALS
jgi:hypothetical protein